MTEWSHSSFLDGAPNDVEDHRYLTDSEIDSLPIGVYYKKKNELTRHRFIRFLLHCGERQIVGEAVDDRGHWRLLATEIARIAAIAGVSDVQDDCSVLAELGLDRVLPPGTPLPEGHVRTPSTPAEIERLYADYTDMHEQGHFDTDSPDFDRLELLTSWIPGGARTLDLGCNSGAFGAVLIAKGCEVHGVDLSDALVEAARIRGVKAVRSWAEQTPYIRGEFDAVICAELLEHALDPLRILVEARRVLRAGGLLVGSVPHADGPWGVEDMGYHPEHLWAFTEEHVRSIMCAAGFDRAEFVEQTHATGRSIGLAFRALAI